MKKVLFALSIVGLTAMVSCKKEEVKVETESVDTSTSATDAPVVEETTTTTTVEVPKFSTNELQTFASDYAKYSEDVIKASQDNDASKLADLQGKAGEWSAKAKEAAAKMTPEDAQKWADFSKALADAQAQAMK